MNGRLGSRFGEAASARLMINAPLSECERGVQGGRHKATLPPRADGGAAVAFDKRPRFSSSSLEPFLQFREAVAVAAHEP